MIKKNKLKEGMVVKTTRGVFWVMGGGLMTGYGDQLLIYRENDLRDEEILKVFEAPKGYVRDVDAMLNSPGVELVFEEEGFGARQFISTFLQEHALSQRALAEELGVQPQHLNEYLVGNIDSVKMEVDALGRIEDYYQIRFERAHGGKRFDN